MSVVTITGQVAIPKAVRDALGIGPGSSVDFVMDPDGRIVLRKAGVPGAVRSGLPGHLTVLARNPTPIRSRRPRTWFMACSGRQDSPAIPLHEPAALLRFIERQDMARALMLLTEL
nr:AbrB/MazE/SpoVT family DNA-binding domain-containing protein [uncultured Rhodopila sp.]